MHEAPGLNPPQVIFLRDVLGDEVWGHTRGPADASGTWLCCSWERGSVHGKESDQLSPT